MRSRRWKRRAEKAEMDAARLAVALRLTQEYVGDATLPALPGWSWYDALVAYNPADFEAP